jgi:hypothetical protein
MLGQFKILEGSMRVIEERVLILADGTYETNPIHKYASTHTHVSVQHSEGKFNANSIGPIVTASDLPHSI